MPQEIFTPYERYFIGLILEDVAEEMGKARAKHGPIPVLIRPGIDLVGAADCMEVCARAEGPMSAFAILVEEVGEASREAYAGNTEALRAELVQVAAMAVAYILGLTQTQAGK